MAAYFRKTGGGKWGSSLLWVGDNRKAAEEDENSMEIQLCVFWLLEGVSKNGSIESDVLSLGDDNCGAGELWDDIWGVLGGTKGGWIIVRGDWVGVDGILLVSWTSNL